MGGTNNNLRNSHKLEIDNFGKKELVDFLMNIFLITEDRNIKHFFKKLIDPQNEQNENLYLDRDLDRDNPLTHIYYKGWKYYYYEKQENENRIALLNKACNKIKEWKNVNNNSSGNTFIIYLQNFENNVLLDYLEIFIEKGYSEGEQPFILFLINRNENEIKEQKKKLEEILKKAAQNFINKKYAREERERQEKLNNLVIEEYYMPYNIFLIPYIKGNENNINNDNNNIINNINDNSLIDSNNDNNNNLNNNIDDIQNIPNNDNRRNNNIIGNNGDINNQNIVEIQKYLLKFASCYNEIGDYFSVDEKNDLSFNFFNILCVGWTGAGKSTFVNTFFNERKTIVGEGNISKTQRINFYSDQINHIRIYDTIGFEDEKSANIVRDLLQKLNVELINCKNKIHLILYFIIDGSTSFQKCEYDILNEILKYKAHIIFIKNKCKDDKLERYKKDKTLLYSGIKTIFKEIEQKLKLEKIPQNQINDLRDLYANVLTAKCENFILMNLRRDINNYSPKIFGMDKLFRAIYDYFKEQKIRLDDIQKIEGLYGQIEANDIPEMPIYSIIKDNYFLHSYKTIKDILNYTNKEKKSIIIKNGIYACLSGLNPIPFVDIGTYYLIEKNLKRELSSLYHFDIKNNIFFNDSLKKNESHNNKIYEANKEKTQVKVKTQTFLDGGRTILQSYQIGKKISDLNSIKNLLTVFVNGCKSSILFSGIGMLISGSFNFGIILYVGNKYSKLFENELTKDNGERFLLNASRDFNDAIESFSRFNSRPRASSIKNKNIKKVNQIYIDWIF